MKDGSAWWRRAGDWGGCCVAVTGVGVKWNVAGVTEVLATAGFVGGWSGCRWRAGITGSRLRGFGESLCSIGGDLDAEGHGRRLVRSSAASWRFRRVYKRTAVLAGWFLRHLLPPRSRDARAPSTGSVHWLHGKQDDTTPSG